jgi:uncharacterized protein involved in propanediol utilization
VVESREVRGGRRTAELAGRSGRPGERIGVGYAPAHHGELLQGVFEDPKGRLHRALVTLPQPRLGSQAIFRPGRNGVVTIGQPELTKALRAAEFTLRQLADHPAAPSGGHIEITSDVPWGLGMGSSTSDVTATIRAVADYHGVALSPDEVGRLAVASEAASDSIMISDRVVLFAHRDGIVLETLGYRLPPMIVVGCDTAPGSGGVDTLKHPPALYNGLEIGTFQVLRATLRRAIATQDVALVGRVATTSARINQQFLPKPDLEALIELARRHSGCGVQISHSGTVAGLIFDPRRPESAEGAERCIPEIEELGFVVTCMIETEPTRSAARVTA